MASTQKVSAPTETWIALLGRRDTTADGIADYCEYLGQNLAKRGIELRPVRVGWIKDGWIRAVRDLWRQSKEWRSMWVIPQYTAMAWSNRGFPVGALTCVAILRVRRVRCAMLFHEPWGVSGPRAIDKLRCRFQNWTIRTLHHLAEKSIFTIPLDTVPWLPANDTKSVSIPLGPNIPENLANRSALRSRDGSRKTVVVFCVSEPPYGQREIEDVAAATRAAVSDGIQLRVVFVGRGTAESRDAINRAFEGTGIEVCNRGTCEASEVSRIFSESDAMLAVRGRLHLRRGSALAGLACGLPMVAYAGGAEGSIIDEAGITLVPFGDQAALGSALREILSNDALWREMHEKNLLFEQKYLSWNVIVAAYVAFLGPARE
jgi:glycosyltransferase involved in cell wall biosynthesis